MKLHLSIVALLAIAVAVAHSGHADTGPDAQIYYAIPNPAPTPLHLAPAKSLSPPMSVKAIEARNNNHKTRPTILVSTSRYGINAGQWGSEDLTEKIAACLEKLCAPGKSGEFVCDVGIFTTCKVGQTWWVDKGKFRSDGDILLSIFASEFPYGHMHMREALITSVAHAMGDATGDLKNCHSVKLGGLQTKLCRMSWAVTAWVRDFGEGGDATASLSVYASFGRDRTIEGFDCRAIKEKVKKDIHDHVGDWFGEATGVQKHELDYEMHCNDVGGNSDSEPFPGFMSVSGGLDGLEWLFKLPGNSTLGNSTFMGNTTVLDVPDRAPGWYTELMNSKGTASGASDWHV